MNYTEVLKRLEADAALLGAGNATFGMVLSKAQWAASARILRCATPLINMASVDLVESEEADALIAAYESALKDWPL